MKLGSVLALKKELLTPSRALLEGVAAARSFSAFVAGRDAAVRAMAGIALGVARAQKQHYLAVQYVGKIVKFAKSSAKPEFYRQRRRPLSIGSSVCDVRTDFDAAGTLGCFVKRRRSPRQIGMLTNNHVIANENRNPRGTPVVQPGTLDGGHYPTDQVAELVRFVRLRRNATNYVDAAIATLIENTAYEGGRIGNLGNLNGQGDVNQLPANAAVHKVGRTTGQTQGRATAFDVDNILVQYDMGILRFDSQIEIEGSGKRAFSDSGDSGSLIVDAELNALGLLFAGGDQGGANGRGLTYANPIELVLKALSVELEL